MSWIRPVMTSPALAPPPLVAWIPMTEPRRETLAAIGDSVQKNRVTLADHPEAGTLRTEVLTRRADETCWRPRLFVAELGPNGDRVIRHFFLLRRLGRRSDQVFGIKPGKQRGQACLLGVIQTPLILGGPGEQMRVR